MSAIFEQYTFPFPLAAELWTQEEYAATGLEPEQWLDEVELTRYRELQNSAVAKRWQQWLLGRYAAKVACRRWMAEQGITVADWREIRISNAPSGMPRLEIQDVANPPSVSIAHSGNEAVAAVASGRKSIGVDLEARTVSTNLHALAKRICSDTEYQRWIVDVAEDELVERFRYLWLAKEAVAKCTSNGLQWQPGTFEVIALQESGAEVRYVEQHYLVHFDKSVSGMAALSLEKLKS